MNVIADLRDGQMIVSAHRAITLDELTRTFPDAMHMMDSQLANELAGDALIMLDPGWGEPARIYVAAGQRRYNWHAGARVWTRFARGGRARPHVVDDGTIEVRAVIGHYHVTVVPRHTKRSAPRRQIELACEPGRRSRHEDPLGFFTGMPDPALVPNIAVLDTLKVSYRVVLE